MSGVHGDNTDSPHFHIEVVDLFDLNDLMRIRTKTEARYEIDEDEDYPAPTPDEQVQKARERRVAFWQLWLDQHQEVAIGGPFRNHVELAQSVNDLNRIFKHGPFTWVPEDFAKIPPEA